MRASPHTGRHIWSPGMIAIELHFFYCNRTFTYEALPEVREVARHRSLTRRWTLVVAVLPCELIRTVDAVAEPAWPTTVRAASAAGLGEDRSAPLPPSV